MASLVALGKAQPLPLQRKALSCRQSPAEGAESLLFQGEIGWGGGGGGELCALQGWTLEEEET